MSFHYKRVYRESIQLTIFDMSGTTMDHGSVAPLFAFTKVFEAQGIQVTIPQARGPMGMDKWDHIKAVSEIPAVAAQWESVHGRPVADSDVDQMFEQLSPILLEILPTHSELIPGTAEAVEMLRQMDSKIGSSTGYFDAAFELSLESARKQGYEPDFATCATRVSAGRPAPWMIFQIMEKLNVYPPEAVVKMGDTVVDVESALNAGVWAIGIARTGNSLGASLSEWEAMAEEEQENRLFKARTKLMQAGAHFVIDTIKEAPDIVDEINDRLWLGQTP